MAVLPGAQPCPADGGRTGAPVRRGFGGSVAFAAGHTSRVR